MSTSIESIQQNYWEGLEALGKATVPHALSYLKEMGLPAKKNENYKYTRCEKFIPQALQLADPKNTKEKGQKLSSLLDELPTNHHVVFINGKLVQQMSVLPEGLNIEQSEIENDQFTDAFEALNIATNPDTYRITCTQNKKIEPTSIIHLIDANAEQSAFSNLVIEAEKFSESVFVEIVLSESELGFHNGLTSVNLQENAFCKHIKVPLTAGFKHIGKLKAQIAKNANLYSLTISMLGDFHRNNIEVHVNGEGAHTTVNGLYTARSDQHFDNFSTIHHHAAHTTSNQVFKGILDDVSRGVFTGKVIIHRDAQQVDSSQLNKNLLLAPKAHVDTRPQIEVYADDVKCGHGATVGQINPEEVFYLESRGIKAEKARKILCHAFAMEVLESCENKDISNWLGNVLFENFEKYVLDHINGEIV